MIHATTLGNQPQGVPAMKTQTLAYAAGAVLVLGALMTLMAVWSDSGASTFTMQGTYRLEGENHLNDLTSCMGRGDYQDVSAGAGVQVLDSRGAPIASDSLKPDSNGIRSGNPCTLKISISNVPAGQGPYSIKISGHAPQKIYGDPEKAEVALTAPGS